MDSSIKKGIKIFEEIFDGTNSLRTILFQKNLKKNKKLYKIIEFFHDLNRQSYINILLFSRKLYT